MNYRIIITIFALVLIFLCPFSGFSQNLVSNGDFSEVTGNQPKGWYPVGLLPDTDFKVLSSGDAAGNPCISISNLNPGNISDYGPLNWAQDIQFIAEGQEKPSPCIFKAKIKTVNLKPVNVPENLGAAMVGVQCWQGEKMAAFGTTQLAFPLKGDNDWTEVEGTVDIPLNTDKIRVLCMIQGTGQVMFDDIELFHSDNNHVLTSYFDFLNVRIFWVLLFFYLLLSCTIGIIFYFIKVNREVWVGFWLAVIFTPDFFALSSYFSRSFIIGLLCAFGWCFLMIVAVSVSLKTTGGKFLKDRVDNNKLDEFKKELSE